MKKIPFEEFEILLRPIKSYLCDLEKSNEAISNLCPSSYSTIDLGCDLLDSYIDLVQVFLQDVNCWINWFVFDNDYGKNELECYDNGKTYLIKSEKDMYNFLTNT